jgi:poly-gamma-glutamate synthesis protein (capsule biosynthesis protein)
LANNHVFDYGEEGLADTLDALDEAGIASIGAGRNLKEASAIHYEELEGCTVAFLAATRVEWSAQTQPATKKDMGVFYTAYDTDLLYQRVKEAKEKADFVVVCMHWGIEGTGELEEYQTQVGKGLADAGADLVVGDHPHVLQGVELVEEVPVFYSLGNYWFNRREEYTMLLKVELRGDKYGLRNVRWRIIPAWQGGAKVKALTEEDEQRAMFDDLESLPGSNVRIDQKGYVKKR